MNGNPFADGTAADTITDFSPGTGGDVLDIQGILSSLTGYVSGENPFTSGFLRVQQSGSDAVLEADQTGDGADWQPVFVLQGVDAGELNGFNFVPQFSPDGIGQTIDGTPGVDSLIGTEDGDTISGLGGNDDLHGRHGDDVLNAGDGNDSLAGDQGDDTLDGGAGNDSLQGGDGDDHAFGGEGDDYFYADPGNDFYDGGAGADRFADVGGDNGSDTYTGGAGVDTYLLGNVGAAGIPDTITDFAAGSGGDVVDLSSVLAQLAGYTTGTNPFTSGHLQLVSDGSGGSLLQWDQDGGGDDWSTILAFANTADGFTHDNFFPAFEPNSTANNPPVAENDGAAAIEDGGSVAIPVADLLANDSDADASDTISLAGFDAVSASGASVTAEGTNLVYDPGTLFQSLGEGATFTDSFGYTITDGEDTASARVEVTVTGVNDAPVAAGDAVSVGEDGATVNLAAALLANDTDVDDGDTRSIVGIDTGGTSGVVSFDTETQTL
ncbi:MAG TPA: Ig-like domain-containing protein, partial [Thermomicrobiales bacterium]|nr:Ig-like domain-containing protein [Thermomicrobiales bacterium]